MDHKKDYVLDMIIKNLEDVNASLDNLSKYTTDEIMHIKIELSKLTEELKQMKSHPCPKSPELVKEIIETERLRHAAKQPKERRDIALWVVAIVGGIITILFGREKFLK
jgi:hypothetical protein